MKSNEGNGAREEIQMREPERYPHENAIEDLVERYFGLHCRERLAGGKGIFPTVISSDSVSGSCAGLWLLYR